MPTDSIEPETRQILEALARQGRPPLETMTPDAFRSMISSLPASPSDAACLGAIADTTIAGVRCRSYQPLRRPRATMLYFHGGGFVVGDLNSCDAVAQAIVARTGVELVSVDYRLAPEYPFPAAVDDACAVLAHFGALSAASATTEKPLLTSGDSAGGNLAAVVALRARDAGIPILQQTLFYPVVDANFERPSYLAHADQAPLTRAGMMWFWDHYAPAWARGQWRATPINAELAAVAPAHILLASHDILRDEGIDFAERLRAAGNEVWVDVCEGMVHGFVSYLSLSPGAQAALQLACDRITQTLNTYEDSIRAITAQG